MESENLSKLTINYLTELEYLKAKTDNLLNDDELYMTPDDTGAGSIDIYSTEEVKTNKILVKEDGTLKRVYRKRFDGYLAKKSEWTIFATLDDIETLIDIRGSFLGSDGRKMVIPHSETGYEVTASIKNKNIEITQTGTIWYGRPCYIIVEYTKTTDEENSGVLSSGDFGINEVYSTNEIKTNKIWVDGRPIYRKTIIGNSVLPSGTSSINHNVSNIGNHRIIKEVEFQYNGNSWTGTFANTTSNVFVDSITSSAINFNVGTGWANLFIPIVTIEYTKTTD